MNIHPMFYQNLVILQKSLQIISSKLNIFHTFITIFIFLRVKNNRFDFFSTILQKCFVNQLDLTLKLKK